MAHQENTGSLIKLAHVIFEIIYNQKRATFVRFVNLRSCVSIFVSVRKQASNRPKSVATWHLVED